MLIEIVGVRERIPCIPWVTYASMQGNIVAIPLTIGEVLVSLIALFVPFWRSLELIVALISLTCVISIYFIPESPRWLIAQGKVKEAKEVILKAARQNDVETFVLPSCDNSERSVCFDNT